MATGKNWRSHHTVWLQVQKWTKYVNSILVCYVYVVTLHDYTTDTNDDTTTMTVFHTEHINTNTWVCLVSFILCHCIVIHCTCTAWLKSKLCPSFIPPTCAHDVCGSPSTLISPFFSSFTSRTSCRTASTSSPWSSWSTCALHQKRYGLHWRDLLPHRRSDQDDHWWKESYNETRFQNPQRCAWLVVRSNQLGQKNLNQVHRHQKPLCRHLNQRKFHTWTSGIICCVCSISAISVLQFALLQWQNRAQQQSGEGRVTAKITTYDEFDRKNAFVRVFFSFIKPGEDLVWISWTWTTCSWRQRGETWLQSQDQIILRIMVMTKIFQQDSGEETSHSKIATNDESYCEDGRSERVVLDFSEPGEETLRKSRSMEFNC